MVIRKANGDDAKKVLEYLKIIGGETDYLTFGPTGIHLTIEQEREYLEKNYYSNSDLCIVADDNGEIVGILNLNSCSKERMMHNTEIGISVKRSHWHKGIASMLMTTAIEFARKKGIVNICLTVRSDNERAKSLYTKFGFEKTGVFYRYIKINDKYYDCDMMQLFLK